MPHPSILPMLARSLCWLEFINIFWKFNFQCQTTKKSQRTSGNRWKSFRISYPIWQDSRGVRGRKPSPSMKNISNAWGGWWILISTQSSLEPSKELLLLTSHNTKNFKSKLQGSKNNWRAIVRTSPLRKNCLGISQNLQRRWTIIRGRWWLRGATKPRKKVSSCWRESWGKSTIWMTRPTW